MKKLIPKLRKTKKAAQAPSRITNDTVAEHRERVLAGGRKFKYPIQYARHKLVINTILICVVAVLLVLVVGWWQLYKNQNTSGFVYRVTRVIPVPVAQVDGEMVRYSDYLMKYRSAEYYLRSKERTTLTGEDGKRQLEYQKQRTMENVVADAYARKIAKEKQVTVTSEEVDAALLRDRSVDGSVFSQSTQDAVIRDYYDWSPDEYRDVMEARLLRQKVAYEVDDKAEAAINKVKQVTAASKDKSFQELMEAVRVEVKDISYGTSGLVPKSNQDGGLAQAASKLEVGATSEVVRSTSGDGYYIVRLLEKNDTQVNYEYFRVPLTELANRLKQLYADNKVSYFISVKKPNEE